MPRIANDDINFATSTEVSTYQDVDYRVEFRYEKSTHKKTVEKSQATHLICIAYKFVDGMVLYGASIFTKDDTSYVITKKDKDAIRNTAIEKLFRLPVRLYMTIQDNSKNHDTIIMNIRKAMFTLGTCSRGLKSKKKMHLTLHA